MMNQQFSGHARGDEVAFVNREQNLGVEGLRRAKLSYRPHHLEEKFGVRLVGL